MQPIMSERDQEDVGKYQSKIDQLTIQLEGLKDQFAKLSAQALTWGQQIQQSMESSAEAGFSSFNQGFTKMISGGESFTRVMQTMWTGMVDSFIESVLKMSEKWLEQHLLMAAEAKVLQAVGLGSSVASTSGKLVADKAQVMSDAGVAAAGGFASQAFIPIVGPALGTAAAQAAFAQVMAYGAFEKGGIVPGAVGQAVPIIAHAGEGVMTERLTRGVLNAAGAGSNGSSGNTIHLHYNPSISSIDTRGVSDMLREHGEAFTNHMMNELRRSNAA